MLKSFVIRTGRYTTAQKKAYELFSDGFLIPFSQDFIDFEKIFYNKNDITLEIGFGSGTATAEIAQANQNKNYLGIEVHRPGIGRLLWEIEKRKLSNIRIIEHDAADVIEKMIPQGSLEAVHVFFPDPWPKKKHRKRRLIQKPFTEMLSDLLKENGYFYMVTDWEDYALHALDELKNSRGLKNAYKDFAEKRTWRPKTKFEEKGLAKDYTIRELFFLRETL
ncbi:MAG: tRNA (guanosine(46)-N7)-methyltransferase TrmB [Treponema sp.]|nr:tRNA (guanosine(46)-N7)-methyltransferase TrmB [Treponema sp.]